MIMYFLSSHIRVLCIPDLNHFSDVWPYLTNKYCLIRDLEQNWTSVYMFRTFLFNLPIRPNLAPVNLAGVLVFLIQLMCLYFFFFVNLEKEKMFLTSWGYFFFSN